MHPKNSLWPRYSHFRLERLPNHAGNAPENWFSERCRLVRLERLPNDDGNAPENWFSLRYSVLNLVRLPNDAGNAPENSLSERFSNSRLERSPNDAGNAPENSLSERSSHFRLERSPNDDGILPDNWLSERFSNSRLDEVAQRRRQYTRQLVTGRIQPGHSSVWRRFPRRTTRPAAYRSTSGFYPSSCSHSSPHTAAAKAAQSSVSSGGGGRTAKPCPQSVIGIRAMHPLLRVVLQVGGDLCRGIIWKPLAYEGGHACHMGRCLTSTAKHRHECRFPASPLRQCRA